jgi:hypothetical protein
LDVRVESYAGSKAEERPLRICIDERKVEVAEVLDRWYGPDHEYWKLLGDDGWTYLLRYDRAQDLWDLHSMTREA